MGQRQNQPGRSVVVPRWLGQTIRVASRDVRWLLAPCGRLDLECPSQCECSESAAPNGRCTKDELVECVKQDGAGGPPSPPISTLVLGGTSGPSP